jgi:predicted MFS family arabinose efflux permease
MSSYEDIIRGHRLTAEGDPCRRSLPNDPSRSRRTVGADGLVPVLVFLGLVVSVISSLGAPLIPSIAVDYRVTIGGAQWSLTIALLVGAVTAPVLGRLGDGPHRRRVILSTLGLVMLGSALAALSLSFGWLLNGRGLQGCTCCSPW